jgi:hypothetical protein
MAAREDGGARRARGKRGPVLECGLRASWRSDGGILRCQRAVEGGLPVCRACYDRVRRDLAELPGLYCHCESLLVRFPPAFAQKVAGGRAAGVYLDERVTDARRDIVTVLASWSGLVSDERGVARPGRRDVADLSAFLVVHLDWLLAHPAGSCFADELVAVAAAARDISRSGPSSAMDLGRCVEEGCDHPMTATRAADGSSCVEVRCAAGHVWRARQWLQLAHQLRVRSGVPA